MEIMENIHVVVCLILLTVSTIVHTQSCDFDTDDFCGWTQAFDDEIDWLIHKGPTVAQDFAQMMGRPEMGTGPMADHTFGDDRGGYATIPHTGHSNGDRGRLVSQEYTVDVELRFWYHLFGSNIFLNVYLEKGRTLSPIFQVYESASTDYTWKQKVLQIVASGPYKIVFETGRDGSFRCQAAIDDLEIIMCGGICEIPPEPRVDCTFDRDMCGFQQDSNDDIDWTRHMRATPNRVYAAQNNAPEAKTGPIHDHTQGRYHNGYYMYIESSTPAQTGDVARLLSPETSGPCLEFYFHMFGLQMGTLQVYTRLSGSTDTQLQWELSGDRGDTWNRAVINHNITDNYQVIFHGEIGGFLSDVAIDDVRTWNETCEVYGGWGTWGNWTDCTATCGGGIESRTRYCDSPPPPYGFTCVGDDDGDMSDTEQQDCNTQPCPVDGGWGPWQAAGDCSVTCGQGTQPIERHCDSPAPQYGGRQCLGANTFRQPCDEGPCPIDGEWSPWSGFSACNVTCGGGIRLRTRLCDNPPPQHGGDNCVGDDDGDGADTDVVTCNTNPCPVDGGWSQWLPWETCSQSCDGGTQKRVRTCTEPVPAFNGNFCPGDTDWDGVAVEFKPCHTQTCPAPTTEARTSDAPTTPEMTAGPSDYSKTTAEVTKAAIDTTTKPHTMESESAPVCTNEYMELALPAHRLAHVITSGLHWDPDPSCQATFNGTHYILRTGLYQCGTKVTFDTKFVIFSNNVSLLFTHDGVITRDPDVVIHSVCKYDRDEAVMSEFLPIPGGLEFVDEGFGQLSIRLDLFHTQSYLSPYTTPDYPVHLHLRDMMYMQLQVQGHTRQLSVIALHCEATSGHNASLKYPLIQEGCASDDTLQFYGGLDPGTQRFGLEAFRFVQEVTTVHIRCEVEVCDAAETGSRCAQGCRTSRHHKRALEDGNDMKSRYIISRGPIIVNTDQADSVDNIALVVGGFAGVVIIAAVLLALTVRRSKPVHPGYKLLVDAE